MLTITLLGTAATMPLPDRALTAAAAECVGHSLLFDCGEGTQAAARRAGVNLMKLDAICLTHYHGDHIFGLPGLLQTLGCQGRTRPLALYGLAGLDAIWPALRTLTGPLPYPVRARQRPLAGLRGHSCCPSPPGTGCPAGGMRSRCPGPDDSCPKRPGRWACLWQTGKNYSTERRYR